MSLILEDRYEILELAGQGAMGSVYRGYDRRLSRTVALKCILNAPSTDSREIAIREARTLASLRHSSLVTIFDVLSVGDQVWLVTEWLEGKSLAQVTLPLSPIAVAAVMAQVLEALAAAHRGGVFHRDIKPSNIMLCSDGRVVLIDFGVAFAPGLASGATVAGSLRYTDPALLEGKLASAQSDLFSAGLVLLEILSGEPVLPDLAPLPLFRYVKETLANRVDSLCDGLYPPLVDVAKSLVTRNEKQPFDLDYPIRAVVECLKQNTAKTAQQFLASGDSTETESALKAEAKSALADAGKSPRDKARWLAFLSLCESRAGESAEPLTAKSQNATSSRRSPSFVKRGAIALVVFAAVVAGGLFRNFVPQSDVRVAIVTPEPTVAVETPLAAIIVTTPSAEPTTQPLAVEASLAISAAQPAAAVVAAATPTAIPSELEKPAQRNVEKRATPAPKRREPLSPTKVYLVSNAWGNVSIDGKPSGQLPRAQPFLLTPGKHTVRIESPVVEAVERVVTIPAASQHRVMFKLEPLKVNQLLMLKRDGKLIVNGTDYGVVNSKWIKLAYGSHRVQIVRENEPAKEVSIRVGPETPSQIFLD